MTSPSCKPTRSSADEEVEVLAFTDGAAKGNPGPGGWGAVLLVGGAAVRELGGDGGRTTNNRMEVMAAAAVLEWLGEAAGDAPADITLVTDSTYLLRGITEWLAGWKKRGWKTSEGQDVANRDLWERLDVACKVVRVRWRYVPGHAGFAGNDRADEIASEFALGHEPVLYSGPYDSYGRNLNDLPLQDLPIKSVRKAGSPKGGPKAHSYVSEVEGIVRTHTSWADCEKRVKGRSGARYRKTMSADEERVLIDEWTVVPE